MPSIAIAGCELKRSGRQYTIQSKGPLGGKFGTVFVARGNTAEVVSIEKVGWLGRRLVDQPIERHVRVLRELGFEEVDYGGGGRRSLG